MTNHMPTKKTLIKLFALSYIFWEIFFTLVSLATIPVLLLMKRIGLKNIPIASKVWSMFGFHVLNSHYYEPKFDYSTIEIESLSKPRSLPGIDVNVTKQMRYLKEIAQNKSGDLISAVKLAGFDYSYDNRSFEEGDADVLFSIITSKKPNRIVEIGSGNSTKIMLAAYKSIGAEVGTDVSITCVEPYEQPWLSNVRNITLIREKVEDVDIEVFSKLEAGDLLFIDSSHIIRPGGDVLFELLEILPRLKHGVIVHIHDIFTPRDYRKEWLVNAKKLWNEQYVFEALISDSERYLPLLFLNHLKNQCYDEFKELYPNITMVSQPSSIYLEIN